MGKLAIAVIALLLADGTLAAAKETAQKKQSQASSSRYAKVCAQLWPRYLQADTKMGIEEFDEVRSPAEIEQMHRQFNSVCLTQGPNGGDIQWLIQTYGN